MTDHIAVFSNQIHEVPETPIDCIQMDDIIPGQIQAALSSTCQLPHSVLRYYSHHNVPSPGKLPSINIWEQQPPRVDENQLARPSHIAARSDERLRLSSSNLAAAIHQPFANADLAPQNNATFFSSSQRQAPEKAAAPRLRSVGKQLSKIKQIQQLKSRPQSKSKPTAKKTAGKTRPVELSGMTRRVKGPAASLQVKTNGPVRRVGVGSLLRLRRKVCKPKMVRA